MRHLISLHTSRHMWVLRSAFSRFLCLTMHSVHLGSLCLCPSPAKPPTSLPFDPLCSLQLAKVSSLHRIPSLTPPIRCANTCLSSKFRRCSFELHLGAFQQARIGSVMHQAGTWSGDWIRTVPVLHRNTRNVARLVRTRASNPQGGGGGIGTAVFNLAVAGLLIYLTVTGRLNWLFDTILSIWLFIFVLLWFAERNLIKGPCPNCGGEFQVLEFSMKEEPRLCPYCSQPFKLENKQFVRDGPQFSNRQPHDARQPSRETAGTVVDIEAEVKDKD